MAEYKLKDFLEDHRGCRLKRLERVDHSGMLFVYIIIRCQSHDIGMTVDHVVLNEDKKFKIGK